MEAMAGITVNVGANHGTHEESSPGALIGVILADTQAIFRAGLRKIFALEDDISNAVSTTLAIKLGMSAGQPLVHTATEDPRAHDLYLRARELSYRSD